MKKIISGLFAAVMMAAGLVASTGSSATAGPCDEPNYPGCADTNVNIQSVGSLGQRPSSRAFAVVEEGNAFNVTLNVNTNGNARPDGRIKLILKKRTNGGERTYTSETFAYSGGKQTFRFTKVGIHDDGSYALIAKFIADDTDPFENDRDSVVIRIA